MFDLLKTFFNKVNLKQKIYDFFDNIIFFFIEYFVRQIVIKRFKDKHNELLKNKKMKINTNKIYIENKYEFSILIKHIVNDKYKINLNNFEYSHITDMSYLFENMNKMRKIPFFDTSHVTNMRSMFRGCNSLTEIPLFDTSNVTDMNAMFEHCYKLEKIPLLNTCNVNDMSYMFRFCYKLKTIPLLNTSNVTYMSYTFNNCLKLNSIPLLDTSNVKQMIMTFAECSSLKKIPIFDIKHLLNDVTKQNKISGMLYRTDYNISKDNFIQLLYQNNNFVLKMLNIKNNVNRQKKINNDKTKDKLLSDFDFVFRT